MGDDHFNNGEQGRQFTMASTASVVRARQTAFEWLVRLYPLSKGKGRWLKLVRDNLDVERYGYSKPLRVGRLEILLDPGDQCDQLFYFGLIGQDHLPLLSALLRAGD